MNEKANNQSKTLLISASQVKKDDLLTADTNIEIRSIRKVRNTPTYKVEFYNIETDELFGGVVPASTMFSVIRETPEPSRFLM